MKVAIITEGFNSTGYGHLSRCIALYQAFSTFGVTVKMFVDCDTKAEKFLTGIKLSKMSWLLESNLLYEEIRSYNIVIIDSYRATYDIYFNIQQTVKKVVYLDDTLRMNYPPGIILNWSIGAEKLPYPKDSKYKLLLGIPYFIVRDEFKEIRNENTISVTSNVFVSFGAFDHRGIIPRLIPNLSNLFNKYFFNIVNNHDSDVFHSLSNIRNYSYLSAKQISRLMYNSDIAIVAAGQTLNELAFLGKPVIAIITADNQERNLFEWYKAGFVTKIHRYDDLELISSVTHEFIDKINSPNLKEYQLEDNSQRLIQQIIQLN